MLGTIGEDGSYVLYNGKTYYASAVHADDVIDTMGAGDSYFAAFLCSLLKSSKSGALLEGTEEENAAHLQEAMQVGAAFAAKMCARKAPSATEPPSWDAPNCKINRRHFHET